MKTQVELLTIRNVNNPIREIIYIMKWNGMKWNRERVA
jgi:hypothetical protein